MTKALTVLAVLFLAVSGVVFAGGAVVEDLDEPEGPINRVVLFCTDETGESATLGTEQYFAQFDEPNILGVQSAGNVVELEKTGAPDGLVLGSIEYAVRVGGATRIIVLGHKGCRVVKSVMDGLKMGGAMSSFVQVIEAAKTEALKKNPKATVDDVVAESVRRTVARLSREPYVLKPAIDAGKLKIVGAVFDFDTLTAEVVSEP